MNTDTALQAHLDGDSTAASAAELSEKYASDADAAHTAVAAALLHARLARTLGPVLAVAVVESLRRPEPLWPRRPRLLTGAAAAAVVLVASLLWPRGETALEAPRVPPGAPRVRLVETPALSEVEPVKATESRDFLAELKDKLDRYYVRPTSFENVRTVRGLIAQLQTEVRAVNHQREPFYDAVTFSVPVELEDRELPERFTAAFCGNSAWTVVEAVGALMNWEARAEGEGEVIFAAGEEVEGGDEVVTEDLKVAPWWESVIRSGEGGSPANPDGDVRAELSWLGASGLQTATWCVEDGAIRASGSLFALRRAENLLTSLSNGRSVNIMLSTKVLEVPDVLPAQTVVLDDGNFQAWMRSMSQTKGVDLMSAPSIVTGSGQAARIEVKGETSGPKWAGIQADFLCEHEGRCLRLFAQMEVGVSGRDPLVSDIEGVVPSGQTSIFRLSEKPGDPNIVVAVTATMIDPSGVPK